jgi:hypothetical protein
MVGNVERVDIQTPSNVASGPGLKIEESPGHSCLYVTYNTAAEADAAVILMRQALSSATSIECAPYASLRRRP